MLFIYFLSNIRGRHTLAISFTSGAHKRLLFPVVHERSVSVFQDLYIRNNVLGGLQKSYFIHAAVFLRHEWDDIDNIAFSSFPLRAPPRVISAGGLSSAAACTTVLLFLAQECIRAFLRPDHLEISSFQQVYFALFRPYFKYTSSLARIAAFS